jgi:hypothetical protein
LGGILLSLGGMMLDYVQRLFERRGFVDGCRKLITIIALCAIVGGVLIVFSPLNTWLISTAEHVKPLTNTTWREFINSYGVFITLFFVFVLYILYPQKAGDKAKINILYLCIAGILAVSVYMAHVYGRQWIDSDMSSEMILGNLLAKENALVTSSWVYSTELRLVYQQLFYMPLFKLFDNWRLVRTITTMLNSIVLLASYFFMMKQFSISKKTVLFTSLFLILPVSMNYWQITLFGGYYVFFIAMFFCYLGLFAVLLNSGERKKTNVAFILFALLSFVLGAGGIRALMDIQVPIFITALYVCFAGKNTRLNSRPFLLGAAGLVLCSAGYAVNFLLHFFYNFLSHHGAIIIDLNGIFSQQLGNIIYGFMVFLGFTPNAKFMSPLGILSFASIMVVFLMFYWAVKIVIRHRADCKAGINVSFVLFFIVSTIYHIALFQIVDDDATSHLLPVRILYVPALAVIFESVKKNMPFKKARVFICGIAFVILASGLIRLCVLPGYDFNSRRKDSIAFLEENNLSFGFASFWNANVITELTNGRIEMLSLSPDSIHAVNSWLYITAYKDPGYRKGETFILLTKEEWRQDEKLALRKPDYGDDNFVIFCYPSAVMVFDEILTSE